MSSSIPDCGTASGADGAQKANEFTGLRPGYCYTSSPRLDEGGQSGGGSAVEENDRRVRNINRNQSNGFGLGGIAALGCQDGMSDIRHGYIPSYGGRMPMTAARQSDGSIRYWEYDAGKRHEVVPTLGGWKRKDAA